MERKGSIYLIGSQTGTILARILKIFTKAKYNHLSISFDKDLESMYSFGRKNAYNPFIGGLVHESPKWGTFKRFSNTTSKIISIEVDIDDYLKMKDYVENMYKHKDEYYYNLLGIIFGYCHILYNRENHYYCSEFVEEVLIVGNVVGENDYGILVKPMEILSIPNHQNIYEGLLKDYK